MIEAALLTLSKNKCDETYETLSGKYKLIKSQIPFVGSKLVEFQDDECDIIIDSPHMSFTMDVIYATNAFSSKAYKEVKKQEQDKKEHTKEMF